VSTLEPYDPTGWHRPPGALPPIRVAPYALLIPPPAPASAAPVEVVEVQADANRGQTGMEHDRIEVDRNPESETRVDVAGGFTLRTWIVRFWLAVSIRRRKARG
jgi:hypothetical protein